MDELVAEDYIDHSPPFPDPARARCLWQVRNWSRHLASTTSRIRPPRETRSSPRVTGRHEMISGISETGNVGDDGDRDPRIETQTRREVVVRRARLPPATRRHPYARSSRLLSVGSGGARVRLSPARGRSEPPRNADHQATQILPSSSPQSGRSQRPLFHSARGFVSHRNAFWVRLERDSTGSTDDRRWVGQRCPACGLRQASFSRASCSCCCLR